MRVLLVSANQELVPDPVFPLGLSCLAGALQAAGHDYEVVDFNFDSLDVLEDKVRGFDPGLIGISLRNIDNVSYPKTVKYLDFSRQAVARIRKITSSPVVLGGAGFSLYPEQIIKYAGAEYGIVGSGEEPLVELIAALQGKRGFQEIPGLLPSGGNGNNSARKLLPVPNHVPAPAKFRLDSYLDMGGMASVQTRRGCAFKCIYCSYPLIEGDRVRTRPVEDVLIELTSHAEQGAEVFFVDSVFNQPVRYAREVCEGILRKNLSIRWTAYCTPGGMDRDMAELFKQSGCMGVEFGTDALSERMLANMGKSFDVRAVEQASEACRHAGLPLCHAVLVGGPGEDETTLEETISRLERLPATAVIFMSGIRIIPRTKLHRIAIQEGAIDEDDDLLEPRFYLSPPIAGKLEKRVRELAGEHKNWIFPGYGIRCSDRLACLLRKKGVKGPLWLGLDKTVL